jgi:hypothetical protein
MFDSDEDVGGDIFEDGDDDEHELVEIDVESRLLDFVITLEPRVGSGFFFQCNLSNRDHCHLAHESQLPARMVICI